MTCDLWNVSEVRTQASGHHQLGDHSLAAPKSLTQNERAVERLFSFFFSNKLDWDQWYTKSQKGHKQSQHKTWTFTSWPLGIAALSIPLSSYVWPVSRDTAGWVKKYELEELEGNDHDEPQRPESKRSSVQFFCIKLFGCTAPSGTCERLRWLVVIVQGESPLGLPRTSWVYSGCPKNKTKEKQTALEDVGIGFLDVVWRLCAEITRARCA